MTGRDGQIHYPSTETSHPLQTEADSCDHPAGCCQWHTPEAAHLARTAVLVQGCSPSQGLAHLSAECSALVHLRALPYVLQQGAPQRSPLGSKWPGAWRWAWPPRHWALCSVWCSALTSTACFQELSLAQAGASVVHAAGSELWKHLQMVLAVPEGSVLPH